MFLDWHNAFTAGSAAVGGKGWNLARLDRYGFRVPLGGVLTAGTPDDAIEAEIAAGLAALGLTDASLAVRSSAVAEDSEAASFAGIHESFLNVRGLEAVAKAVRACRASAHTPRARAYRDRLGIGDDKAEPAVVIMAMAPAVAAGVAFSCDPRSGREDRVFVSANFGLGETVVGGKVDPDEFTVDVGFHAPDMVVSERRLGRKELTARPADTGGVEEKAGDSAGFCLSDTALIRLARLAVRIREALGHGEIHQDIEWVWDGADFWLVQARPVTTRPDYTYDSLRAEPALWTNGNIRDALPMMLRPLATSLSTHCIQMILECFPKACRYDFLPGLTRFKKHRGRGYMNLSVMQWEFVDAMAFPAELTNRFIGGHQRTIAATGPTGLRPKLRRVLANVRVARAVAAARKQADAVFAGVHAMAEGKRKRNRTALPDHALVDEIRGLLREFTGHHHMHLLQSAAASTFIPLSMLLGRFCKGEGDRLAQALLIGQSAITSAEHGARLAHLAEIAAHEPEARAWLERRPLDSTGWRALPPHSPFRREFERFLEEFGHRSVYELDVANPRWREDQTWLVETIAGMMGSNAHAALKERRRRTVEEAWATIGAKVPRPLHGIIRKMAKRSSEEAGQREMAKSLVVRMMEVSRLNAVEIAARLVARGILPDAEAVHFLTLEDLQDLMEGYWDGHGAANLVADRRALEAELAADPPPDVLEGAVPVHATAQPLQVDGKMVLAGMGVAAGRAEGVARVILTPTDGARLGNGDILVAPSTDPGWTPLFLRAAALVTETGGFVSHGAIVAREYGIPAVVNIPGLLSALSDGTPVTVDGSAGRVVVEA